MIDNKALMQQAYRLGFLRCAGWAQRDDLFADVDSPTYKKDCQHDLSAIAQPVPKVCEELIDYGNARVQADRAARQGCGRARRRHRQLDMRLR